MKVRLTKPKDKIRCPCCKGKGRVPLTGVYLRTLKLLRKHGETYAAELCSRAGCTPTAMNNRLAWLRYHGHARSRRDGRRVLYSAFLQEPCE